MARSKRSGKSSAKGAGKGKPEPEQPAGEAVEEISEVPTGPKEELFKIRLGYKVGHGLAWVRLQGRQPCGMVGLSWASVDKMI